MWRAELVSVTSFLKFYSKIYTLMHIKRYFLKQINLIRECHEHEPSIKAGDTTLSERRVVAFLVSFASSSVLIAFLGFSFELILCDIS
jgi:hypothetical protein